MEFFQAVYVTKQQKPGFLKMIFEQVTEWSLFLFWVDIMFSKRA